MFTYGAILRIFKKKIDGKDIEVVTKFGFLGALITKDGICEKKLRRRITMAKAAMGGLISICRLKDLGLF